MVGIFAARNLGLQTGSGAVLGDLGAQGMLGRMTLGRDGESVAVNAANGNLLIQRQDEFLVGRGLDASFVQTYNALAQPTSTMADENGDQWRQGYDSRIFGSAYDNNYTSTGTVSRVAGDGSEVTYTWNGNAYVATDGAGTYDTLVHTGTTWVWTDGDTRAREVYYDKSAAAGVAGRLKSRSDADGNTMLFGYDASNRLQKVTTADGATLTYVWDITNPNNISEIDTGYTDYSLATPVAKTLTRTTYGYDPFNRLTSVTVDLSPGNAGISDGNIYTTTYTYVSTTSKRVASITQTDGSSLAIVYDTSNRVKTLTQTLSTGSARVTNFAYGQVDGSVTYTAVTDAAGQETRLYTDANGNLTKILAPAADTTTARQAVTFTYNSNGDVTQITDALGQATTYTYDSNGNWLTRTSPGVGSGTTTVTRTYGSVLKADVDPTNGPFAGTVYPYSTTNPPSQYADNALYVTNVLLTETTVASDDTTASGATAAHTTRNVYDLEGHLRYTIGALGEVTEYRYTGTGDLSYEIAYPEQRYSVSGLSATTSPSEPQVTAWVNGLADRSSTEIAKYTYDARGGLLTSVKYGIANTNGSTSAANGSSQYTYVYDQEGELLSRIDGAQNATTYTYDGLGRVISTTGADGGTTQVAFQDATATTVVTLANGLVQTSTYNTAGGLLATTDNQSASATNLDPDLANASQWSLTNVTRSAATAIAGNAAYLYTVTSSGSSALTTATQAVNAGDTVTFEILLKATGGHNTNDRIGISGTVSSWGSSDWSRAIVVSGPGTVTRSSAGGGLFDVAGLSSTAETRIRVTRTFTQAESAKAAVYVGNSAGNALAGDQVILAAPSVARSVIPINFYDQLGRERVTLDATGNFHFAMYDNAGRKTADIAADGSLIEYKYDADNHLLASVHYATKVTGSNLTALADPNTSLTIANLRPTPAAGDEWNWHVYDNAGRLIETIGGDGAVARFDYDETGNLVRTIAYVDSLNAVTLSGADGVSGFRSAPPTTAVWPTSANTNAGYTGSYNSTRTFYDKQGRQIGLMDRLGGLTEIVYDASGRKIDEVHYEKQALSGTRSTDSFATLKADVTGQAGTERHTRYVYDGQLLRYVIDGLNFVTQYDYDTSGAGTTTIRYRQALLATTTDFTFDNVKALLVPLADNATDHKSWTVVNAQGQVVYTIDSEGGVTGFTYDTVTKVLERTTTYTTPYSTTSLPTSAIMDAWLGSTPSGAATTVAAAAGNRTTRSFNDARGQLVYAVDAEGYVSETTFDEEGRVLSVTRYDHSITGLSDSSSLATVAGKIAADKTALAYTQVRRLYDGLGRLSDSYDAGNIRTHYDYLATGEVWKETAAYGTSAAVVKSYTYDAAGRVASVVADTGGLNATTSYTYDAFGNIASVTDPVGNKTYNYYDLMGRLIWSRDAENYVTKTVYSGFGDVASVTRYATAVTSAVSAVPVVTTSAADGTTTYSYDKRGLLSSETFNGASVRSDGTTEAGSITNTYAYDTAGNRIAMVEASGLTTQRTTTYGYDRNNRLISVSGDSVKVLYGIATGTPSEGTAVTTTTTSYDALGNATETAVNVTVKDASSVVVTSASGVQARTLTWYDRLGRKTDQVTTGSSVTKGTLSHWDYDAVGNVQTNKVYGDEVTLPTARPATVISPVTTTNVRTTTYAYDRLNRLTTTSVAGVLVGYYSSTGYQYSTQTVTTTNMYDAVGNLVRQTDGRSDNTYSYYDKLGRKVAQVDRENYLTVWSLDGNGNALSETRYATPVSGATTASTVAALQTSAGTSGADRTTAFTYDGMGRRETESRQGVVTTAINDSGVATTTTATVTITYTYNARGEVASKQEATGDTTTYTYDGMGRMTQETDPSQPISGGTTGSPVTTFSYDGLGNLTRSVENGRVTQYEYYASGKLKALTNADGVVRTYYYDGASNKVAEKYKRTAAATTYDAMTYAYDAAGRMTTQGYATVTGTTWAAAAGTDTTSVAYNAYGEAIGRGINLTSAQLAAGAYQDQFSYDNAGHMWRTTAGDGTVNLYVYDENGNQTLDITSSGKDKLTTADTTTTDTLLNNYVWAQDPLNPVAGKTQLSLGAALGLLTNNGTNAVGGAVVQGMIVTQMVYDGRNQLTQTRMPLRDRTSLGNYSAASYKNLKSYNAFGEVASETDARGNTTNYTYNTLGKVIKRELPAVSWTSENGTVASARPTENYYYDASGRVVGVQDANGNVNTRTLLAGTGYGKEAEALVLKEFHADTGVFERQYDLHHDLRVTINEVGKTENYTYDALGQLIEQDHQIRAAGSPGNDLTGAVAVQLKDFYDYDNLGHRTLHTNSQLTASVKETAAYDIQGRVTSQVDLGGDTTSYSYAWDGTLATNGIGTFGGWSKVTTNSSGKTRTDKTDYYGRTVDMIDYGGHNYDYTFDLSGRLVGRVNTALGETITWAYFNTGMMQSQQSVYGTTYYGSSITATYQYDADNHRTFEGYEGTTTSTNFWTGVTTTNAAIRHQHAYVTWDAAGRMTSLADSGHNDDNTVNGYGPVQINWEYDLGGNIRHMAASYRSMDSQGNISSTASTQDYWYRYDAMNRFTTSQGMLAVVDSAGNIQKNASGQNLVGDLARGNAGAKIRINYYDPSLVGTGTNAVGTAGGSQGREVLWSKAGERQQIKDYFYKWETDRYGSQGQPRPDLWTEVVTTENYTYSDDGYLASAAINGTVRSRFTRDAMGRVSDYREYSSNGYVSTNPDTNVVYQRNATYNGKSLVLSDIVKSVQGADTFVNTTTYYYNADATGKGVTTGGTYMGGAVTLSSTAVTKNGTSQTGSTTTNTLVWWGGTMQSLTNFDSGSTHNTSTFNYDQSGHLQSVYIQDGRPRTINFVTDLNGQILTRQESDNRTPTNLNGATDAAFTGDPKEIHYYFNGMGVGDISNNGTSDVDYVTGIAQHTAVAPSNPGAFRGGGVIATPYADFDQSYDPINGLNYAATSSRYTVQGGDTLTSIAQAVWGDASFWYMIADANGLDGTETLVAGQSLILPNKVHNSHNNSSTYRVYDPNEAIGNTAPTAVAPPKQGSDCGFFGQLLLAVIAIATTALTWGAASAAYGPILGPIAAATSGAVAAANVGILTGINKTYDFKGIALAAITAGIGAGIGQVAGALGKVGGVFGDIGKFLGSSGVASGVVRGALANSLTQGIATATGLQDRFDWVGVAAAGVGGGVTAFVGDKLNIKPLYGESASRSLGNIGANLATSMAGNIANAATRSVIEGTDFGDNIIAALPDTIANTVGNLAAEKLASIGRGGGGDPTNLLAGTPFDGDGQLLSSGGGGAVGHYLADGSAGYAGAPLLGNGLMSQDFVPGLGVGFLAALQDGPSAEFLAAFSDISSLREDSGITVTATRAQVDAARNADVPVAEVNAEFDALFGSARGVGSSRPQTVPDVKAPKILAGSAGRGLIGSNAGDDDHRTAITYRGKTTDGLTGNQIVRDKLKIVLGQIFGNATDINSINISATTNGHDAGDHVNGLAVDINYINGVHVSTSGPGYVFASKIKALAMSNPNVRYVEGPGGNFARGYPGGPFNPSRPLPTMNNHVHISVFRN